MIAPAAADPRGRVLVASVGNLRGDDRFALTIAAPFQGRLPTGANRIETDVGGLGGRDAVDLRLLGPDPWAPALLLYLRLTVCVAPTPQGDGSSAESPRPWRRPLSEHHVIGASSPARGVGGSEDGPWPPTSTGAPHRRVCIADHGSPILYDGSRSGPHLALESTTSMTPVTEHGR